MESHRVTTRFHRAPTILQARGQRAEKTNHHLSHLYQTTLGNFRAMPCTRLQIQAYQKTHTLALDLEA